MRLSIEDVPEEEEKTGGAEQGVESKVNPVRFSITWSDE